MCIMYLGNLEQILSDLDNVAQGLDILDTFLDGAGVVGSGLVEDILDLLDLAVGPLLVQGSAVLEDAVEDGQQAEGDDGFLVEHVKLVADGPDGGAGAGGQDGCLAGDAVAGQGVNDRLGLLLRIFGGDVGGMAHRCRGHGSAERWQGSEREG